MGAHCCHVATSCCAAHARRPPLRPNVSGADRNLDRKRTAGSACLVAAKAAPVGIRADAQVWQASHMRCCTLPATRPSLDTSVFPHQTLHTSYAYTCHALLGLASCSEASVQPARAAAAPWARIAPGRQFGIGCFRASTMCRQRKHPTRQDASPVNRHTDTKYVIRPYTRRKQ